MATPAPSTADPVPGRPPTTHARPSASSLGVSPASPKTPLLGRSISSQFGSPSGFRSEQDDVLIYEVNPRQISAGFSGESQPRCILPFTPDDARRQGDYRHYDPTYLSDVRNLGLDRAWAEGHELYHADLRDLDLGLVEDKLDRALRTVHSDFLQLDHQRVRKAIVIVPPSFPTPLLDFVVKLLFARHSLTTAITVLATPVLCCVGAGLRSALVVDVGWEETTVTAVGEYKDISQRRSVRAAKLVTLEMASKIESQLVKLGSRKPRPAKVSFAEAEDFTRRLAWCRVPGETHRDGEARSIRLPLAIMRNRSTKFSVSFDTLAEPVDAALFPVFESAAYCDDHDLPIHWLAYRVLLSLPVDLRAVCLRRIVITGELGKLPGLKRRILHEIAQITETRGWDPVWNYGSATAKRKEALQEGCGNLVVQPPSIVVNLMPGNTPAQDAVPHANRVHDDIRDSVTLKAERDCVKTEPFTGDVRGVETLGSFAGASLMASLKVKGVHEIEKDDFLKNGLRNLGYA